MAGIKPNRIGARLGWLITTLGLGIALIASAWANYWSARQAADDLVQAQAQLLRDAIFPANRARPWEPGFALDSLVAAQTESGLRYIGWVALDARIGSSAGIALAPTILPDSSSNSRIVRVGSRVRAIYPPRPRDQPPPRPEDRSSPAGDSAGRAPPSGPGSMDAGRRPPTLVFEFEPTLAAQIVSRALGALIVAGMVALALMTAGVGFWRLSQRIEENERRMEEQRRLTLLGEMSAVLAHEIRNPLASLKGHAQLLVERLPERTSERRKADRVVEEAARLEALTTDLLDFARTGPMDFRPVDPVALLRACAGEVSSDTISVNSDGAPERWTLDERRFRQAVLENLLRNAVQASPPDRPPEAQVTLRDGHLVFTVRDHGSGLPPGDEDRIFDPFYTTRINGTGLGLPIARRIVELHGGRIVAANAPGGGALFTVELPRREA